MNIGWKLVPVVPTEEMLNVMHGRVLISVDARKKEANILNDKAWWAAVVDAAPQPPALGGEPEVLAWLYKGTSMGDQCMTQQLDHYWPKPYGKDHDYIQGVALIDRVQVATLLADNERLKVRVTPACRSLIVKHAEIIAERDTLKALIDQVRTIADERAQGYASRMHGGVLNGRCMDKVCALFEAAPVANVWPCWSCKEPVSMSERADADGDCPHCHAELDIEMWPFPDGAPAAKDGAVELERLAKAVYGACFSGEPGFVPWVDGGNSLMQDKARDQARKTIEAARHIKSVCRQPQAHPARCGCEQP